VPPSDLSCKSSEPEDDGCDGEFGLVVGGAFGMAAAGPRNCLSRLKQRSTTLRCRYRCFRIAWRVEECEQALFATTTLGRVRGRPGPALPTWMSSSSGSNGGFSPAWPPRGGSWCSVRRGSVGGLRRQPRLVRLGVCGLPRPIPLRQITPRRTRAQLPQNHVGHLPMITPPPTPATTARSAPTPIPQLTPTHHNQEPTAPAASSFTGHGQARSKGRGVPGRRSGGHGDGALRRDRLGKGGLDRHHADGQFGRLAA
jgi:hypothetical protein